MLVLQSGLRPGEHLDCEPEVGGEPLPDVANRALGFESLDEIEESIRDKLPERREYVPGTLALVPGSVVEFVEEASHRGVRGTDHSPES